MRQEVEAYETNTPPSQPQILFSGAQVVLTGHKQDGVDAKLPVSLKHCLGLPDEDLRFLSGVRGAMYFLGDLGTEEDCTLWSERTQERSRRRKACSCPEEGTPAVR